jgi:small subunit ribosomal protein S16
MLVIRLARVGRENLQQFRLVAQEKTSSPKSGKVVATLGSYNPANPDNKLVFDAEKIEQLISNGATPSDTVARLLLKNGFKKELVEKFVEKYTKQKSRKEAKAEKPAGEDTPAKEGEDAKAADADTAKPAEDKAADTDKPAEEEKKEEAPKEDKPAKEEKPAEEPKTDEKPADADKKDS